MLRYQPLNQNEKNVYWKKGKIELHNIKSLFIRVCYRWLYNLIFLVYGVFCALCVFALLFVSASIFFLHFFCLLLCFVSLLCFKKKKYPFFVVKYVALFCPFIFLVQSLFAFFEVFIFFLLPKSATLNVVFKITPPRMPDT